VSELREIEIEDLLLDHENPRLGTVESQSEALRELIDLDVRHFETMMESIKLNGLDPGDLFFLVDESIETGIEGYTVVDGNRRVAALKVLREPALLSGAELPESTINRLRAAADGFDSDVVGDSRLCVVFNDRAEAVAWIMRRHGRGQEGEGRIAWGPLEIQRFQGDRSVLDILDFMDRNGGYSPSDWIKIRGILQKRSFVLRRFLESKAGRNALGIGEEYDGTSVIPTSSREPKYLVRVLRKLLDDIVYGAINTRKYNKSSQIQAYFDTLPSDLHREGAATVQAQRFHDLNIAPPGPSTAQSSASQTSQPQASPPKIRDTLAPKQLEFQPPINAKGAQFIREATRLKLKNSPLSCAFLLRGFIQFAVDTYMLDNSIPFWENNKQLDLHIKADRVIDHLIENKRAKRANLNGIRRRLAEKATKNPSSNQALNDYHHDQYQVPDAAALRAGWDEATALFVAILGRAT
jgi:hypothetical protein